MCPEHQVISIYADGELPSPWKEKLESHIAECSVCREKLESFKTLRDLFKTDTKQTIAENALAEQELMEAAKEKVWRKLESRRHFRTRTVNRQTAGMWHRRFAVPLPAAAAAAVVIMLVTAIWVRSGADNGVVNNGGFAAVQPSAYIEAANSMIAPEEEMPGFGFASDINSVLQYLSSSDANIIILQLPENNSFSRISEPEIIRAADHTRRVP
ncbi:MAG: zf-HC2 domain-containing protein [Treponema sp.]|jgi:anti-sigma factor RsiW|nr:zf-HC2 domain-containing protein [Treponema sp.]